MAKARASARMSIGSRLRQARDRRGLTRRDIAEATKISMAALRAIEEDDVRRLPGGIYNRCYLRAYAEHVGLNPDPIVGEYVKRHEQPESPAVPQPPARQPNRRPLLIALVLACAVGLIVVGSLWFRIA